MNLIYLNVIRKDAEIFLKYIDDYKYMISLTKADEIIEALEINDAKEYYEYQLVLKQLTNISYSEATFLKRIEFGHEKSYQALNYSHLNIDCIVQYLFYKTLRYNLNNFLNILNK